MSSNLTLLSSLVVLSLVALPGCSSDDNDAEPTQAGSCTIVDIGDGNSAIRCPDGSEIIVKNGKDGAVGKDGDKGDKGDQGEDAEPCTLGENAEGKNTLTCGGKTVVIGDDCEDGYYGTINLNNPDDAASKSFTLFQVTNCTWIRGDVLIDFDGETLPKAVSRIERIDGALYIAGSLETVSFPSLKTVGDELVIRWNDALKDIDGFPALESVGEWLEIYENDSLERLGNFKALAKIGGLSVFSNPMLESLADFPVLETIGGCNGDDCEPGVYVASNDSLSSIEGLDALKTVNGDVGFYANPELPQADIDALIDSLEDFTGNTYFCGNKGSSSGCD